MASQTFNLGRPNALDSGSLIWRQGRISNEPLISDLVDGSSTIYLVQISLLSAGTTLHFLTVNFGLQHNQFSGGGEDLSDLFETQGKITFNLGGNEFTLNVADASSLDRDEPYTWTISDSTVAADLVAWKGKLNSTDTGTVTLDDGAVTSQDYNINSAGTPEWEFETTEPTITHNIAHMIGSAGTPEWEFETTEPTVTHRTTKHQISSAGTPEWEFETTEPTITHNIAHKIGSAGTSEWEFETTEPTVTFTEAKPVTKTEYAYRIGADLNEATHLPTSRAEALPAPWNKAPPQRTATQGIYRIASEVTRLRGVFVSRGAWSWDPVFERQPYQRSINDLSLYVRKFVTVIRDINSGALASIVTTIQADPPAGADGEEGVGVEYIFASFANTDAVAASEKPSNAWAYDTPGTAGTTIWSDGTPSDVSDEKPFVRRAQRQVPGFPTKGDTRVALTATPKDGEFKAGPWVVEEPVRQHGVAGADGEEGPGVEYIFAAFADASSVPTSQEPSDSWAYDTPGTVDGVTWTDGTPSDVGAAKPYVRRAQRAVRGSPVKGDTRVALNATTVGANEFKGGVWIVEAPVRAHGEEGDKGDKGDEGDKGDKGDKGDRGLQGVKGADGEEASGVEYIFASFANTNAVASSQLPSTAWAYDTPGTVGGLTWYDGTPSDVSDTKPYVRRAQRRVLGAPTKGDTRVALNADSIADGEFRAGVWVVEAPIRAHGEKGDKGDPGNVGGLNTVYLRAAIQPATPATGSAEIPTGWFDDPPTGTNQLWASNGSEDPDNNDWSWQEPVKAFERTEPPTVSATATGDDVRIVVTDPSDTTGIIGHRIDLEILEGGDWRRVDSVTHVGLTTARGRGKTFAELPAGQYRAEVQTAVSPGFIESAYVVSGTVRSAGGTVTADNIPSAPPTPTAVYSEVERTITANYQDPPDNGGSHLVAFLTELYKDGQLSANRIAAERKGVLQGRSYIFREITEEGIYYVRTAALNANNGSPAKTTDDKNWSDFSAPVVIGDVSGIVNKVTALGVGETYIFESTSSDAVFRITAGAGTISDDGIYTAPDIASSGIRIGLFEGSKEIDFNEFSVSLDAVTFAVTTDRATNNTNGHERPRTRIFSGSSGASLQPEGGNFIYALNLNESPENQERYSDFHGDRTFPSSLVESTPTYLIGVRIEPLNPEINDSGSDFGTWDGTGNLSGSGGLYKTGCLVRVWLTNTETGDLNRGGRSNSENPNYDADFVPAFENAGTIRFRWVASDGSSTSASFRAKGVGPNADADEPYIWYLTEQENADIWNNLFVWEGVTDDDEWEASTFLIDFIPDTATGIPSGTINNKITSLNELDQHQYKASSVVGGIPTFISESDNVLVSPDGVVVAKDVSSTTAANSETIGLYVRGTRIDSDSFRINSIPEKGRITNKISQLYAHQSHTYQTSGVQGGVASFRLKSGIGYGSFAGNTFKLNLAFDDIRSPVTRVIELVVGGVVVDDDTFTIFPSIARIANRIDTLDPDQTYQFRPAANRAPGKITWEVSGVPASSGTIDANGVYTPISDPSGYSPIVSMLLDGVIIDEVTFFVKGTTGNLVVRITNPIEAIKYGQSHTFIAEVTGRNLTGARTVTWQTIGNDLLFGTTTKLSNELQARFDAPAGATSIATSQGFAAEVQVIVDQSDSDGNSHTSHATAYFWVSPSFDLNPPTVEIFVTQDDVRIIVFDAYEQYPGRAGYRVKLQKKSGNNWNDVETVNISGAVGTEQGAGRTFNNLGKGIYRGAALTTASGQATQSEEVFTEEVEVDRDYPDLIAGAPPKPTLSKRGNDLILNYQNPSDDGGTHLVRFALEVYRDGTEVANRIGRSQEGVRRGREKIWYNFAATFKGELRARAAAVNANSQGGGPLNWSPMSDPLDNS